MRVYDPAFDETIPRGKQFWEENPQYLVHPSSGIWQSVWLEYAAEKRLDAVRFTALYDEGKINLKCSGCKTTPKTDSIIKFLCRIKLCRRRIVLEYRCVGF
ncbi:MAG: hypothetical protein ACLRV8_03995 [Blautia hansenii]